MDRVFRSFREDVDVVEFVVGGRTAGFANIVWGKCILNRERRFAFGEFEVFDWIIISSTLAAAAAGAVSSR